MYLSNIFLNRGPYWDYSKSWIVNYRNNTFTFEIVVVNAAAVMLAEVATRFFIRKLFIRK